MSEITKAEALVAGLTLLQYIQEQAGDPRELLDLHHVAVAILTLLEWKI